MLCVWFGGCIDCVCLCYCFCFVVVDLCVDCVGFVIVVCWVYLVGVVVVLCVGSVIGGDCCIDFEYGCVGVVVEIWVVVFVVGYFVVCCSELGDFVIDVVIVYGWIVCVVVVGCVGGCGIVYVVVFIWF